MQSGLRHTELEERDWADGLDQTAKSWKLLQIIHELQLWPLLLIKLHDSKSLPGVSLFYLTVITSCDRRDGIAFTFRVCLRMRAYVSSWQNVALETPTVRTDFHLKSWITHSQFQPFYNSETSFSLYFPQNNKNKSTAAQNSTTGAPLWLEAEEVHK